MYIDNLNYTSKSQDKLDWLKSQLKQKFNIKDLDESKKIIRWMIIYDIKERILKITQKIYIQDFLVSERMSLYYSTFFPMKIGLFFAFDQAKDFVQANIIAYQ